MPGAGDVACWGPGTTVTVSSPTAATADSIQGGSLTINGGTLTLSSTTDQSTIDALSLDGSGELSGPSTQTVTVTGGFEWGGCSPSCGTTYLNATIDQTGSGSSLDIDGSGSFDNNPDFLGGSITTSEPVSITNANFESTASGSLSLTTTSTIDAGSVQLLGVGNITFSAAGLLPTASLDYGFGAAPVDLTGGTTTIRSTLQAGSVTVDGGTLVDDSGITNPLSDTATPVTVLPGAALTGSGNMGDLDNAGGIVIPGDAANLGTGSTMTVSGTYSQSANGELVENITTSGAGLLQITGTTTLAPGGAELVINDGPGVTPTPPEADVIVTSDSTFSGIFSSVAGSGADAWSLSYPTRSVRLDATSGTGTGTGTSTTPTTTVPTTTTPAGAVPVDTALPAITGNPTPGHSLSCSTGTWTNSPTGYAYGWSENGTRVSRDTTDSYAVAIADEGSTLTCTVTASNATGTGAPATSPGDVVAEPGTLHCPQPTGALSGGSVGPLTLGMTQATARHRLTRFVVTHNNFDNFCLYGGWGVRVGYPTARVLSLLPSSERSRLTGRVVLALTANPYYALDGVRPGMALSAVAQKLHVGPAFHIGSNYWYLAPGAVSRGVLKVRGGIIQEVGIANTQLTAGDAASQRRFLSSFKAA